jgi:hypothetical protein
MKTSFRTMNESKGIADTGITENGVENLWMANYRIGRKRRGVMWSNNVTEGNPRLVF